MLDTSASPFPPGYSPSPSSASVPSPLSATLTSDPDGAWNLIPCRVSWAHEYEEYRGGTLPGPDGDCVFLRSPTPLKNQRASEACKKCRERKTKCTGAHPACARCTSRDYVCEYASQTATERRPIKVRRTLRDWLPKLDLPRVQAGQSVGPEAPMHIPSHEVSVKNEESESMALRCIDHRSTSACWEGSTPSNDFPMEEPWEFSEFTAADEEFTRIHQPHLDGHLFSEYGSAHSLPSPSSILAPQPVHHSSLSHLSGPGEDVLPLYAPMHPPARPLLHNAPTDQSHFVNIYPSPELKTEPDYGGLLSHLSSTTSMLGLQEEQEYDGAIDPYYIDVEDSAYAIHLQVP
ncbi:hypothetical protein BV25DRAFT_1918922 [Artomyces pyxidatus]|uniref:Uncharacterized protein n=1 Tax=Artomyces pyxidatus TaxID=48021 RepID=A0ACB8SSA8_9AGAM|nr:hypothetical protein BV25DRAFT_1918922 [Artomyces pyxidatus]